MSIDNLFKSGEVIIIRERAISVDEDHPIGFQCEVVGKVLQVKGGYAVVIIPTFEICATYDTSDLKKCAKGYSKLAH